MSRLSPHALPERYLITPAPPAHDTFAPFVSRIDAALASGIRLLQLRAKAMTAAHYRALTNDVSRVCRLHQARLILNGPALDMDEVDADGVQLDSVRLMACTARPFGPSTLVSASCHTLDELKHAERLGLDFVTLSPVLHTASHPETEPLGWARFAELVASVTIPVYALGGMTRSHISLAKSYGAQGVAGISGFWQG